MAKYTTFPTSETPQRKVTPFRMGDDLKINFNKVEQNPLGHCTDGVIYVNPARTDTYTANGSVAWPFTTLVDAIDVADEGNKIVVIGDLSEEWDDESLELPTGVEIVVVNGLKIEEGESKTLTALDSGKTIFFNSDSGASDFVLPPAIAGLKFKFAWVANKTTATTITTADTTDSTGDMLRGGLLVCAAAGVNTFVEASGDVNKMTFDDDLPNSAAGIGSWVQVECVENGIWLVTGVLNSTTDPDSNGSAIFSDVD